MVVLIGCGKFSTKGSWLSPPWLPLAGMEMDRARAADLKDELHRNCGPTVLVLPTAPVHAARPLQSPKILRRRTVHPQKRTPDCRR